MAKMPTFFLFDDFDLGVVELIHQRIVFQITLLASEFPHKPIETEESTVQTAGVPVQTMANEVVSYGGAQGATAHGVSAADIWSFFSHDWSMKHVGFVGDCCGIKHYPAW